MHWVYIIISCALKKVLDFFFPYNHKLLNALTMCLCPRRRCGRKNKPDLALTYWGRLSPASAIIYMCRCYSSLCPLMVHILLTIHDPLVSPFPLFGLPRLVVFRYVYLADLSMYLARTSETCGDLRDAFVHRVRLERLAVLCTRDNKFLRTVVVHKSSFADVLLGSVGRPNFVLENPLLPLLVLVRAEPISAWLVLAQGLQVRKFASLYRTVASVPTDGHLWMLERALRVGAVGVKLAVLLVLMRALCRWRGVTTDTLVVLARYPVRTNVGDIDRDAGRCSRRLMSKLAVLHRACQVKLADYCIGVWRIALRL